MYYRLKSKRLVCKQCLKNLLDNTARIQQALIDLDQPLDKLRALIHCELQSVLGETGEAMSILVYEWRSLSEENQQV